MITFAPFLISVLVFVTGYTKQPSVSRQKELAVSIFSAGAEQQQDTGQQNAVIAGDFADPSIIRRGKFFYATGTSSEWAPHFPLFKSNDLIHWQQTGYVLLTTPPWASSSFWAPELFYYKQTYYVYYVARKKTGGISCIGVATSKDPAKGFTDHGILLEFGKEAIDPFTIEDNGELYITFKAYGLDKRPIEILGCRLSDDGLKVEGEPFMLLRDEERKGLEGQCMVKRNNYYYLLYSAGDCCGRGCSYKVSVARSSSLKGPYVKYVNNPILTESADWKCPGHGTIVTNAKGADYFLYHAYSKQDDVYTGRQGMLAQVNWNPQTGWPAIQPVEGSKHPGFRDEFLQEKIADQWQWDFRHTQPVVKTVGGILYFSGDITESNQTGTALTVRPFTGNYEISTAVVNHNASLKGLVIYGDANLSTGIGIKDSVIQVWVLHQDERKILHEVVITTEQPVYLKISVEDGYKLGFYWGEFINEWKPLKTGDDYFNADFLPPWDRSPRPGLLHDGLAIAPAAFDFFEINYK